MCFRLSLRRFCLSEESWISQRALRASSLFLMMTLRNARSVGRR